MKLIALDSSGLVASVAVLEDETLVAEYTVNYKKTHSQTLLPMLEEVKKQIDLDLDSVDAIAVAAGPGSFTGLRIGSATAKGLGLALKKPIIPVETLDALAYNLYGTEQLVCPMMDARRGQVYSGIYCFEKSVQEDAAITYTFQIKKAMDALPVEEQIQALNEMGREVVLLGDGVPVYETIIRERMKVPYCFAPASCNRQRASSVAMLAAKYYAEGKCQPAKEHAPIYLRLSQAERERMEKEAK